MPLWHVTLPDFTIRHDGQVEINGGSLELRKRGVITAAFGSTAWLEVYRAGEKPDKVPIPNAENEVRITFAGDDLTALKKLGNRWGISNKAAAIRAVTEAWLALKAV